MEKPTWLTVTVASACTEVLQGAQKSEHAGFPWLRIGEPLVVWDSDVEG